MANRPIPRCEKAVYHQNLGGQFGYVVNQAFPLVIGQPSRTTLLGTPTAMATLVYGVGRIWASTGRRKSDRIMRLLHR